MVHQRGDRRQQGRTQKRQGLVAGDRTRKTGPPERVFLHPLLSGCCTEFAHRVLLILAANIAANTTIIIIRRCAASTQGCNGPTAI